MAKHGLDMVTERMADLSRRVSIIVAGGGLTGACAAMAAAQKGKDVLLVERSGMLGGLATSGLMTALIASGRCFGGYGPEFVRELHRRGATDPAHCRGHSWVPYQNEPMKRLLDEKVLAAGVDLLLYTSVVQVRKEGRRLAGIVLANQEGLEEIAADVFIDATGDGILSVLAGEDFECGDPDGRTQAPTMVAYYADVDMDRCFREAEPYGGFYPLLNGLLPLAVRDGFIPEPDPHHPGPFPIGDGLVVVNAGHVFGADCLSGRGLTDATIRGRKLAYGYYQFYKKYVPGFEKAVFVTTGSVLGVRETRRILGRHVLRYQDKVDCRRFEDGVMGYDGGPGSDVHASSASPGDYEAYADLYKPLQEEHTSGIATLPYRTLLARHADNLLVAGRCLSADRKVQGHLRVIGYCMMMGQVMGLAAAQSLDEGKAPDAIGIRPLQAELQDLGIL